MFVTTNPVKNNDKCKYVYCCYGKSFDNAGLWSFGNSFANNVVIFYVDHSSWSHTLIARITFQCFSEGPTDDINGSIGATDKKFTINFNKAETEFCLSLHYNDDNNYLVFTENEIYTFKASNRNVRFPTRYCLGSISKKSDEKYH